ncbi:probable cytochrome P450 9f2 [Danaus plexippus]|uniref:probable cytochrome P450 9f2 n=1 Tax=Danaus plexippus TaxID=13037 RepID=UPI002AB316D3|nr:probable cytochrome P450 9f2 [Danaus plexippus]
MIIEIVVFILTSLIIYFIYIHKSIHKYFDDRGIKYLPGVPIFGNNFRSWFLKRHLLDDLDSVYKAFPEERYVGYIEGTTKIIIIRDPEITRNITVKDFQHFTDHKTFFSEETEPLFGGSLFSMKGERWHSMRTTLSPAFTSSKMRLMMPFMSEISSNIVEYLKGHVNEDVDVQDLMRRYTNDVIASAAFGLQVNSVEDRDNEFFNIGRDLFSFTFFQRFYMIFVALFPNFTKNLGITIFPKKVMHFFKGIVVNTMQHREKNNIHRPDMIQLLMEASKGTLKDESDKSQSNEASKQKPEKEWTLEEIASQVFIFFAAGYETSASTLVMCIHELALNPDVQEKLYQEIKEYKEKHGEITFEHIHNLKYLDCVLNETSRKWSAALIMDRACTIPYELPPPREGLKPVQLQPGDVVYNMVNCIHMDPIYHPSPEKFEPERFSDENKHKIKPFTYMPFGMGPRICIGIRFAQLEIKILIFELLLNFKIVKCPKTMDPVVLKPDTFNIQPKDDSIVRFVPRYDH